MKKSAITVTVGAFSHFNLIRNYTKTVFPRLNDHGWRHKTR